MSLKAFTDFNENDKVKIKGQDEIFRVEKILGMTLSTGVCMIFLEDDMGSTLATNENEVQKVFHEEEYPEYYI